MKTSKFRRSLYELVEFYSANRVPALWHRPAKTARPIAHRQERVAHFVGRKRASLLNYRLLHRT